MKYKIISEQTEALDFARDIQQGQRLVTTIYTAAVSEAAFMQQIVDLAHLYGWLVYHTFDSRRSAAGFPDLSFCHPARHQFFFAELKAEKGRLSPAQKKWIEALQAANIEIHVWRPADFDAVLARLAHTITTHPKSIV